MKATELFNILTFDISIHTDFDIAGFGDAETLLPNVIGYCGHEKYLTKALKNPCYALIFCPKDVDFTQDKRIICVDEPERLFYKLYVEWYKLAFHYEDNNIHSSVIIPKSTQVSSRGVMIGEGSILGENIVVHSGTSIGKNCQIGNNCRLGGDGFMVKKVDGINMVIPHDGKLIIADNVHLGSTCSLDKGLLTHDTIIGFNTCIDSHVYIAHGCDIGRQNIITSGVMIGGFVTSGEQVYFGINSSVRHKTTIEKAAFLGMGSCVVKNVPEKHIMVGNPARQIGLVD